MKISNVVTEDMNNPETWPVLLIPNKLVLDLYHVTDSLESAEDIKKHGFQSAPELSHMSDPIITARIFFSTNLEQSRAIQGHYKTNDELSDASIVHLRILRRHLQQLDPRIDIQMPESSIVVKNDNKILRNAISEIIK